MNTIYERPRWARCAQGLGGGLRAHAGGREVSEELAVFGTTTEELLALRAWLACTGCR